GVAARPSGGDDVYARDILAAMPSLEKLVVIIARSEWDDLFELHPYVIKRSAGRRGIETRRAVLHLTLSARKPKRQKSRRSDAVSGHSAGENHPGRELRADAPLLSDNPSVDAGAGGALTDPFERVRLVYDLNGLARCRVVAVGVGGAAGW